MKRHQARETALKMLFQIDVGKNPMDMAMLTLEEAIKEGAMDARDRDFVLTLVQGVLRERESLDDFIRTHATGWKLERIHSVEKNIIRLSLFEIRHLHDVPYRIAINEAIELAKEYSGEEAGAFVNGVLDNVKHLPGFQEKECEP